MSAADFSISTFFCHFLADRPPVDGGSDRIRSDPRRTQADSADFFWVRLSPPESASADALADWLADPIGPDRIRSDPIGSAADPRRTKSADYSPQMAEYLNINDEICNQRLSDHCSLFCDTRTNNAVYIMI